MKLSKQSNEKKQNPYRSQKLEIKQIIQRIDKKRSMEIFLQRSEGSLIQNQIKNDLQKLQRKSQKAKTFSFFQSNKRFLATKRKINTQNPLKLAQILQKFQQQKKQSQQILLVKKSKEQKQSGLLPNSLKCLKRHNFMPQLQELSKYLSVNDKFILQRRRKIIQMLVLCLMRRSHKKLYQALDIAIQVSSYFEENDNETILKSICLKLIGKIYKQINLNLQKSRTSLSRRFTKKSQNTIVRRHSSFMIKTLASQRAFFNRFAHRLNKSKLVKQTNFQRELKLQHSIIQQRNEDYPHNKQKGKIKSFQRYQTQGNFMGSKNLFTRKVLLKIDDKLAFTLPPPQILFKNEQKASNYNIILHRRNPKEADKLFPIEYPLSLKDKVDKTQYILFLSTINGILFVETQCFTFNQVFKEFSTTILLILLMIFLIMVKFTIGFDVECIMDWGIQLIFFVVLLICCYTFTSKLDGDMGSQDKYEKIKGYIIKWNQKYSSENVIFRITENCQALIVCILTDQIDENSSFYQTDNINQSQKDSSDQQQSVKLNKDQCNIYHFNSQSHTFRHQDDIEKTIGICEKQQIVNASIKQIKNISYTQQEQVQNFNQIKNTFQTPLQNYSNQSFQPYQIDTQSTNHNHSQFQYIGSSQTSQNFENQQEQQQNFENFNIIRNLQEIDLSSQSEDEVIS